MDPSAADPASPPAPVSTPELIQALHAEFSAIKAELAELKRVRALERDRDFDDAENMSDEAVPTWGDILPKRQKEATEHNALALARLFAQPPPQDSVTEVCKDLPHYSGVPEAPRPKDNKYDKKHFVAQQKLQHCMNLLVHTEETKDSRHLFAAAALLRSSYEDIREQRRQGAAGKAAWKLDRRTDLTYPSLFSAEEEKKLQEGRQRTAQEKNKNGKGGWNKKKEWQPRGGYQSNRGRSQSRGRKNNKNDKTESEKK